MALEVRHSCENAISELLSTILKNKETKKHTMAVFLDLSKAFDSLEHEVLYRKLELYGIRGQSLDWYKSYLQNRSMRVKCRVGSTGQIEYSEYYKLDYGTHQGSCLGPLLFLIFSNDLHLVLEHCMGILFADDTTVYKGSTSLRYLKWCLEDDLGKLSDWFRANKLTLNIGKSQCVLFPATKTIETSIELVLGNSILNTIPCTKFLGLWIDQQLCWMTQLATVITKIKRNRSLLQVSKNHLDSATRKIIYLAHIFSHINYCLVTWGNMLPQGSITRLQREQDKCVKLIDPAIKMTEVYSKYNILTVKELIQLENCKLGYRVHNHDLPNKVLEAIEHDQFGCSKHQNCWDQKTKT